MRAVLSMHSQRDSLAAIDAAGFDSPSTKRAFAALEGFSDGGKALVVLVEGEENLALSCRNLKGVSVLRANQVGVADVIGASRLVASPAALDALTEAAAAPAKRVAEEASA